MGSRFFKRVKDVKMIIEVWTPYFISAAVIGHGLDDIDKREKRRWAKPTVKEDAPDSKTVPTKP